MRSLVGTYLTLLALAWVLAMVEVFYGPEPKDEIA